MKPSTLSGDFSLPSLHKAASYYTIFLIDRARLECVPRIHKQDKLREARKLKRKKYLDEIDFPSLLEHFQVICVLNKLNQIVEC